MRKFLLASHSDFSVELKNSAIMIVGPSAESLETFSLYEGENSVARRAALEAEIIQHPQDEFVVLTDLLGASVYNEFVQLAKYPNAFVFTGMNLVMLIDLLTDETPLTDENCYERVNLYRDVMRFTRELEAAESDNEF